MKPRLLALLIVAFSPSLLAAQLRVVSYNTAGGPNPGLLTVLTAIVPVRKSSREDEPSAVTNVLTHGGPHHSDENPTIHVRSPFLPRRLHAPAPRHEILRSRVGRDRLLDGERHPPRAGRAEVQIHADGDRPVHRGPADRTGKVVAGTP